MNILKNNRSFTLVELLVVTAAISTLVAIATPQITGVINRAQDASVIAALSRIQSESSRLQLVRRNLVLFENNNVVVEARALVDEAIGVGALTLNHDSNRRFCSFVTLLDGRTWCTDSTGFAGVVSRAGIPPQYYCTRTIGAVTGTYRCKDIAIVAPPALTGITVTPNPASVITGGTVTFTATPVPTGAPMPGLTWSVAAGGGTITAAGVYTAPATTGSATVRATSGTIFGDSAVTIAPPALTGITVTPNPASVITGGTVTFTATPVPTGAPMPGLTWSVAAGGGTITAAGVYTAPATTGSATVRATSGTIFGDSAVTIAPPALTGITVTPNPASVITGGTVTFTATPVPTGAPMPGLTWSVAAGGGTITAAGVYTAPATTGSATVRATSGTIFGDSAVTITAVCVPHTCAGLGFNCGSHADGCGGTISCGTCPTPTHGAWGACTGCTWANACATTGTGTQSRSVFHHTCSAGVCTHTSTTTESQSCTCTRATDGLGCGTTHGAWGACTGCTWANACATTGTGTQSRSVFHHTCSAGVCTHTSTTTENQSCTCTRGATDGLGCGTTHGAWGACTGCTWANACATTGTGTQSRSVFHHTCSAGVCTHTSTTTESQSCTCTRATDGLGCGTTHGAWGACTGCTWANACATTGTGTQSRSVFHHTCSAGVCTHTSTTTESQSCTCTRATDGVSCGTGCVTGNACTLVCSAGSCTGTGSCTICECGCTGGSCNTVFSCGNRCSDTYPCQWVGSFQSCSSGCWPAIGAVPRSINTGCTALCSPTFACCPDGTCSPCI